MNTALSMLAGLVIGATFLILVAYVTWLFVVRLRAREAAPRSFFRWLRDLFDLALGL